MAQHLDFPNAPTTGQLYPDPIVAGMPQYQWTGYAWNIISSGGGGGSGGAILFPSDVNPVMDGAAAPGIDINYSRGDHKHPSDTSRVNKAGDTMTGSLSTTQHLVAAGVVEADGGLRLKPGLPFAVTGGPYTSIYEPGGAVGSIVLGDTSTGYNSYYRANLHRFQDSGGAAVGSVAIELNTVSNSPSTGALTVTGGVGVGGAVNIAAGLKVNNVPAANPYGIVFRTGVDLNLNVIQDGSRIGLYGTNDIISAHVPISIPTGIPSTSPTTGSLTVGGGVGIGGNLNVGGSFNIANTFTVNTGDNAVSDHAVVARGQVANLYPNSMMMDVSAGSGRLMAFGPDAATKGAMSAWVLSSNASVNNIVWNANSTTFNVPMATASTNQSTGALTVSGGAGIYGNLSLNDDRTYGALLVGSLGHKIGRNVADGSIYIGGGQANVEFDSLNNVKVKAGTGSTNASTGALTVAGGLGVGGSIYTNGAIVAGGAITGNGGVNSTGGHMYQQSAVHAIISQGAMYVGYSSTKNGQLFFGSDNTKSLSCDASNFNFSSGGVNINGALSVLGGSVFYHTAYPGATATPGYGYGFGYGGSLQFGIGMRPVSDTNHSAIAFMNASGGGVGSISCSAASTGYNTSSDADLKEDLKSFDAGSIIDLTKVYDFKWKTLDERGYGVLAQQAVEVYPTAVTHVTNPETKEEFWGVDYSKYVPVLIQELKALRARVKELETGITSQPTASKPAKIKDTPHVKRSKNKTVRTRRRS